MMNYFSTWPEIEGSYLAFLPVGSLEQHGQHLPISTDSIISSSVAKMLSEHFLGSYLLPTLPFSSSFEHVGFPGSVSLKVSTLSAVISDIIYSLEFSGIHQCVIISAHMGNHLLRNIVQEINVSTPKLLLLPSSKQYQRAYNASGVQSSTSADMHAGEGETSIISYLYPEYVHLDKAVDVDCPSRPLLEVTGISYYTNAGNIGFPLLATKEKGKALLEALVNELVPVVKEFVELGKR